MDALPDPPPADPSPTLLQRLDDIDRRASRAVTASMRSSGAVRGWVVVVAKFSQAGSYGIGWIVAFAIVGVATKGFAPALVAAGCVVATLLLNTLIKQRIRRPRPSLQAIRHTPGSWSMPSAHTSMAMVGAATMQQIVPELAAVWWIIAVLLGTSRVLLGMHYIADVVVGALLGLLLGLVVAAPLVHAVS